MSSNDSYNIFRQCKNQYGYNMNQYRQKNINGYDCCFKPNVITFEKVNKYNEVNSSNPIKINEYINTVPQYLFYYQLLNMEGFPVFSDTTKIIHSTSIGSSTKGCKFFADYEGDDYYLFQDIIPSNEFNMYTGTSTTLLAETTFETKIQNNYEFLFNYIKDSQLPLLKLIKYNGTGEGVSLPIFTKNTVSCTDSTDSIKYIMYQEIHKSNYFEYFTLCLPKNQNSVDLQNTNIFYQLLNYMNDQGNICTDSSCNSIDYPSTSGSYIGKPLGENNKKPLDTLQISLIIIAGLAGLIILVFIISRFVNSDIPEEDFGNSYDGTGISDNDNTFSTTGTGISDNDL